MGGQVQDRLQMNERYTVAHLLTASANLTENDGTTPESAESRDQREQFKQLAKNQHVAKALRFCNETGSFFIGSGVKLDTFEMPNGDVVEIPASESNNEEATIEEITEDNTVDQPEEKEKEEEEQEGETKEEEVKSENEEMDTIEESQDIKQEDQTEQITEDTKTEVETKDEEIIEAEEEQETVVEKEVEEENDQVISNIEQE